MTRSTSPALEPLDSFEPLNLHTYGLVLKRRWQLISLISGTILGLSALYGATRSSMYEAVGRMLVQQDASAALIGIESSSGNLQALTPKSDPVGTQAEMMRSSTIASDAIKALNLTDNRGKPLTTKAFLQRLTVKPMGGTDVLRVAYRSEDPKLSATVVNQVMQSYAAFNVTLNRAAAVEAKRVIVKQLPEMERAVSQAEANLRQFKEANGVVALQEEAIVSVRGLSELDEKITDTHANLTQAIARVSELRGKVGMDAEMALAINTLNQSENVQAALTELEQLRGERSKQQTIYSAKHPAIHLLDRQIGAAEQNLERQISDVLGRDFQVPSGKLQIGETSQELGADLARAEVDVASLSQKLQALARSQLAYMQRSQSLPALERTQRELERQLDAAQSTYKTLLTKLQEVQVAENQTAGTVRTIANAEIQPDPVGPGLLLYLVGGGVVGVLTGIAAAFLAEATDRSVKTLSKAKSLFPYTLLGVIPTVQGTEQSDDSAAPQVIARDISSVAAQEAYQMLQANLRFSPSDRRARSIVVTSSVRREGKSTIAANLALALSQIHQRVLLVDADLRNPCQHHVWHGLNQSGLSNLIVGQVEFQDAVHLVTPHLHVLTAGAVPPNPLPLLDSQRMAGLIESFTQDYDFVIFDAPTLMGTADATVLNKMTDGSLLVVRPGLINGSDAEAAKAYLTQTAQTVLGMVVNHLDQPADPTRSGSYSQEPEQESLDDDLTVPNR